MVNFLNGVTIKKLDSEVYLEPSQTSTMESFCENG